jgi:hypothetical protein
MVMVAMEFECGRCRKISEAQLLRILNTCCGPVGCAKGVSRANAYATEVPA